MDENKLKADFIEIIEKNKNLIYKISYMYCDRSIDKKDLYQDIIFNLWKSYPSFRNESKISTWIYRISINTAISWFRDHTKQSQTIKYSNPDTGLADENESTFDELYDKLYAAINSLGKIDRALMILLLDDYSYAEIADIIGISLTNVSTKINRIKSKLRNYISNDKI